MNGCQLAEWTACAAPTMNISTTATLTSTMTLLTVADSRMPITSSNVMMAIMMTAGRLKMAVTWVPSASVTSVPRAADSCAGMLMPTSCKNGTTEPDQPIDTVTAPRAYSIIKSQPLIHAKTSPSLAQPDVYALPAIGTSDANSL